MAEGDIFHAGDAIKVRCSNDLTIHCMVLRVDYPPHVPRHWPDRVKLIVAYIRPRTTYQGREVWTQSWYNADDPDVHHDPDLTVMPKWAEYTLRYGEPPITTIKEHC